MPLSYIVTGQNDAFISGLTAEQIESALRSVQTSANTDPAAAIPRGFGNWVGPRARITRVAVLVSTTGRRTTFAWLFDFPDTAPDADPQLVAQFNNDRTNLLISQAQDALQRNANVGTWGPVTLIPYDPNVNGPRSWWESGQAGDTITRNYFDLNQQLGTQSEENPTGPTTAMEQRRQPVSQALASISPISGLATLGFIVLGIAGIYYLGPLIGRVTRGSGRRR